MLHDEFTLFLAGALGPVRLVAEPLVMYRQHGGNASGGWVRRDRRHTLDPATGDYRRAAEHTRDCARFLRQAAEHHPRLADRLTTGADHYARTAESWELRIALYEAAGRRERARILRRLVAGRAYRPRTSGGFGRAAVAKDLVGGLGLSVRPR
jgi:hypothetical protein